MDKYVSLEKRSKKAQREYHAKQRRTWGELNPVTRSVPSGKTYNRKKEKQRIGKEFRYNLIPHKEKRHEIDDSHASNFIGLLFRSPCRTGFYTFLFRMQDRRGSNRYGIPGRPVQLLLFL